MTKNLKYQIGLSLIPKIGCVNAKKLLAYCGSAEAVFVEKKRNLTNIPGIGEAIAKEILNQKILDRAIEEIEFMERNRIKPLFFSHKDYPERLKHCADSPIMLYFKGSSNLNTQKIIGIVGTRNATEYGKRICNEIVEGLTAYNPLIISGLAYGVDVCAHKAAMQNNLETVGVVAHGLDRIYPQIHKSIAENMLGKGGVLTEFMQGTIPDRENFPQRNRIVAGMIDALIVIESGKKGGALITADIANSYNRDVFAIPGRSGDIYSKGCNFLIKTNRAALIEDARDVAYMLSWDVEKEKKKQHQRELFIELTNDEEKIVKVIKESEEIGIDSLCLKSTMPMSSVSAILLNLEFKGVVKSLPGKQYKLN